MDSCIDFQGYICGYIVQIRMGYLWIYALTFKGTNSLLNCSSSSSLSLSLSPLKINQEMFVEKFVSLKALRFITVY